MSTLKYSRVLKLRKFVSGNRFLQQKSLPPLVKRTETKDLEEAKCRDEIQPAKVQRDIFGATILPQNLSFENAKRLSDNQIRLEDIPLVDENEAAEILAAEKIKAQTKKIPKASKLEENFDDISKQSKNVEEKVSAFLQSPAEMFWAADPFDEIPGPKLFRKFSYVLEQITRQVTIASLFRLLKTNSFPPFKTYGPIVKLPKILGGKVVLISRPEHLLAVLEQDQRPLTTSTLDSIEYSRFRCRRKTIPLVFHLTEKLETLKKNKANFLKGNKENFFEDLDEAAEKFIRRIKVIRNGQNEVPDNFISEINKWSLECLCSIVFNKPLGILDDDTIVGSSKSSQLWYSLTLATKKLCYLESGFQLWRIMNTSSLFALNSACEVLESIISEFVSQVQMNLVNNNENFQTKNLRNGSLIESLLLQDNMSSNDVVSSILDILLIGMNIMSSALGFLFYHLSINPRAQVEVWKEVTKILPEKYNRLEYEHLDSFKYIKACLKESLRMKMPMPLFLRILSKNITISNYQVPKGTLIIVPTQAECMKEDCFEEPKEFLPERWLEQGMSHPFTSLPLVSYFDDTLHKNLAELSIWMCAALVSRHFTIDYLYGDIEATSSTISFPNKPLKFTFTDRKT